MRSRQVSMGAGQRLKLSKHCQMAVHTTARKGYCGYGSNRYQNERAMYLCQSLNLCKFRGEIVVNIEKPQSGQDVFFLPRQQY